MKLEKYKHYSVEDFMRDTKFRQYALKKDLSSEDFWKTLENQGNDIKSRMDQAGSILCSIEGVFNEYENEGQNIAESSYDQLESKINNNKQRRNSRIRISILTAAASIAILIMSVWFLSVDGPSVEYETGIGQTEEILLPDGSIVYLNEKSRLSIDKNWTDGVREVGLKGEAYFMVRSRKDNKGNKIKFTVKTGEIDVEVLGTQFNVTTSDTMTNITLDEGLVKLIQDDKRMTGSLLKPGQAASYNRISKSIQIQPKDLVKSDDYWKPETIEFNQITLRDAIEKMKTAFHINIVAKDDKLLDLEIDKLSVPSDNPKVFIETIKILFADKINLEYSESDATYTIKQRIQIK